MSDDFHAELRFLGIVSSPAFVRQPEGNGCIERFFRTLKEQLLWVRHCTDVEDLQQALRTFKETYNQQWLIAAARLPRTRRRPCARLRSHRPREYTHPAVQEIRGTRCPTPPARELATTLASRAKSSPRSRSDAKPSSGSSASCRRRPSSASRKATGASNGSSAPSRNSCCGCGTARMSRTCSRPCAPSRRPITSSGCRAARLPRTRRRPSRVCAHTGRVNTLTRLSKKSVAVQPMPHTTRKNARELATTLASRRNHHRDRGRTLKEAGELHRLGRTWLRVHGPSLLLSGSWRK